MKFILGLLLSLLFVPTAYPLAQQSVVFANAVTIAAPGSNTTQYYDIRNFTYVDFTVKASAGDGTLTVQYASDSAGTSMIADASVGAFDTTAAASMLGAGVGKHYIRLVVTCVTAPCTYSGWFTAKGQMP